jgi:hypothetical protein
MYLRRPCRATNITHRLSSRYRGFITRWLPLLPASAAFLPSFKSIFTCILQPHLPPWLTLTPRGRIILTLRKSHTHCTLRKSRTSPELCSARSSMVCRTFLLSARVHRSIILGIVIVLFFQCMDALFDRGNRAKGGTKWPLIAHTIAMFLFATVYTATALDLQSNAYIDNREFPGIDGLVPPGPLGYQLSIYYKAIVLVPNLMVLLNSWLADGLLVSSAPTQLTRYLRWPSCSAISLLYHLCQEPLGRRISLLDVSRLCGYVL